MDERPGNGRWLLMHGESLSWEAGKSTIQRVMHMADDQAVERRIRERAHEIWLGAQSGAFAYPG